jgi:hypothetical protein
VLNPGLPPATTLKKHKKSKVFLLLFLQKKKILLFLKKKKQKNFCSLLCFNIISQALADRGALSGHAGITASAFFTSA